jgi:signal transduction histidine kinase
MNRSFWAGHRNFAIKELIFFFIFGIVKYMKIKEKNLDPGEINSSASLSILETLNKREGEELRNILNKMSIGIIILNYRKRIVLFVNEYFSSLVSRQKKAEILTYIYKDIDAKINVQKKLKISQDLVIKGDGRELLLSFTPYRISAEIFIVLLEEVTSGIMYFLTKQENQYFNKLSDLIAEIVHEIGNPLSGINTSLQVLLNNVSNWPLDKVTKYIERTINEINRLADFLGKMREASDENKLEIKPAKLKKLIDEVLIQNEDLFTQQQITYKNSVAEDIIVSVDEGAFHQIIVNLINNSLHILTPGKSITIDVEEVDEYYVKVVYRNDGDPIPEELMEKIFSPLYTTKGKRKGIGLPISIKLMTRMGGTMKAVPPENGIGVKFVLYVPNADFGKT